MSTSTEEVHSVYLIGPVKSEIGGFDLPTNRQVLKLFFYKHRCLKFTKRKSEIATIADVVDFWSKTPGSAGIPICREYNLIRKLERLHSDWKKIQKNQSRTNSTAQKLQEERYTETLDELFDIARTNVEEILNGEHREFLMSQRTKINGGFVLPSGESTSLIHNVAEDHVIAANLDGGIVTDENDHDMETCHPEYCELSQATTQSSNIGSLKRSVSNFSDEMRSTDEPQMKKINIMTPALASALDRTNTSSRNATYILAAAASSLGFNVNDVNMSASTIHRSRIKFREQIAQQLKADLRVATCLVVHWDGKLLPDISGAGTVERLPIIISGVGTEQLLSVPSLSSGTGENQATAIVNTLHDWNLSQRVKAMCFDTTSTNTGRYNGACTLVQQQLAKPLLHLACRHHICELLLRSVVEIVWPTTSGPNVPIFKRFEQNWAAIDTTLYETGLDDQYVAEILSDRKNEILRFIHHNFNVTQPRNDYKEFLDLACIFLGDVPPTGVRWKKPGAMHHARWLSKALYCLKMFMFRRQFNLRVREENGLRHICVFIVNFYVEAWFSSQSAIKAPNHDLQLLQRLIAYENVNADISKAARSKAAAHLWYLSDELAPLALFDDSVPADVKSKMALALREREYGERDIRPTIKERDFLSFLDKDISDFITKRSLNLFVEFQASYEFLDKAVEMWKNDKTYQDSRKIFENLRVVNDVAERGVALIEEFNNSLTKDENQKQYLLQVVRNHRANHPNAAKSTLTSQ